MLPGEWKVETYVWPRNASVKYDGNRGAAPCDPHIHWKVREDLLSRI